jgi:hypothetical protein
MVVPVGKDGGSDSDGVAEDALGRVTPRVDGGLDLFDDDSLATFGRLHKLG